MKKIIVKSENQSGGVTAGEINNKKNSVRFSIKQVIGAASLVGVVGFVVFNFVNIENFGLTSNKNTNNMGDQYFVSSDHQSGGITAGQVNINNIERHLNEQYRSGLNKVLAEFQGKTINITALMGDSEAMQFAYEIKEYLLAEGWEVEGVNQAVYNGPVTGQGISKVDDEKVYFVVGKKVNQ